MNIELKIASLYSGGKDSTFSIFKCLQYGHEVACLITLHPSADDSLLFHYPNSWITKHIASAMCKPLIELEIPGISCKENEYNALTEAVVQAKSIYNIEGIVHGGISSRFQNKMFEKVAVENQLRVLSPLWNIEPSTYMRLLINYNFDVKIISVSAMGLDRLWLGKSIDLSSLNRLEDLSKRFGFNLTFEGGEAETLVTDCPLFKYKIKIERANILWDGQRGIFEIRGVSLVLK